MARSSGRTFIRPAVERTLGVSLRRLVDDEGQRFLELAVFPEDVDLPLGVLERFWALPAAKVRKLCKRLRDLSLLLRYERVARTIQLHDVVRQYLIGEHDDLPALHRRLLERCRPPSGRWIDLAEGEAYLWRHLAFHLVGGDEQAELRRLLFDLDYLEGKLRTVGVNALVADYDLLVEMGEARTVQEALRLSAHVLARDCGELLGQQLAGQLLGRLEPVGDAGRLLLQRATDRVPLRPRQVRMIRPSGPLIRTLEGHTDAVYAVAVLSETRVVSASEDGTLRLWDAASGEMIRTLEGHTDRVHAVAALDETRVVSASADRTLRVWDLVSGETIRTLEGHTGQVIGAVVLDERRVISMSRDDPTHVWDLVSGEVIRTFRYPYWSHDAAVLDATRVVTTSSYDLRLWDMASGETIRTLEDHVTWVRAVAVLDQTSVVSVSTDCTLRAWDVASGKTITAFALDAPLSAVAVTADGRTVIAGDRTGGVHFLDLDLPISPTPTGVGTPPPR